MADLAKVSRNVRKMVDMGAPEADIDAYLASERVPVARLRAFNKSQANYSTSDKLASNFTGGLSDKVGALGQALGGEIAERLGGRSAPFRERYSDALAATDAAEADWNQRNPVGRVAAAPLTLMAGGPATGFGRAALARQGATLGAVSGAGQSRGTGWQQAAQTALSAGGGAILAPAAGAIANRVGNALASRAATRAAEKTASRAVIRDAQSFGIDAPATLGGGRGAAILENTVTNVPLSAGVAKAGQQRAVEQAGQAADNLAGQFGSARNVAEMGEAAQVGARKWIEKLDRVTGRAYEAIPIKPTTDATLDNTRTALTELTRGMGSNRELSKLVAENPRLKAFLTALTPRTMPEERAFDPALGFLTGITPERQVGGKLSWQDMKAFRSTIGEQIGQMRFGDDASTAQLRRVYAALSEDMRKTAAAEGPKALRAFERANKLYADGQMRIEKGLIDLLGKDGNMAVEKAGGTLMRISQSGKGGADLRKMQAVRASMRPEEWGEVSSAYLRLLGRPMNSEGRAFSPTTFATRYDDLAPEAKDMLFGKQSAGLRTELDRFAGVMREMRATEALANRSNTGPIVGGMASITFLSPEVIAGNVGSYAMAKLMFNPNFVRWYSAALKSPSQQVMQNRMQALPRIAAANPAIQAEVNAFMRAANDNLARLAAEGGQGEQQQP